MTNHLNRLKKIQLGIKLSNEICIQIQHEYFCLWNLRVCVCVCVCMCMYVYVCACVKQRGKIFII